MANEKVQYTIEILKAGEGARQAKQDLENVSKASAGLTGTLSVLRSGYAQVLAIFAGTAAIRSAINEFVQAERAVARLNAALIATNQFSPQFSARLQQLADAFAGKSPFGDEAILDVISKLISFGARSQDLERLTGAVRGRSKGTT